MATETSAVNLTASFYLKDFYKYNRHAYKSADRKDYSTTELSYEDTRALKRAIAKLGDFDFSEEENEKNLRNTIDAFVATYNLTLESTSEKYSDTYRLNKQLKEFTSRYSDQLEDIGITVGEDGRMSLGTTVFEGSSVSELKEVFGRDSDYTLGVRRIARRMHNEAYDAVYAKMTGCGGRLNIML